MYSEQPNITKKTMEHHLLLKLLEEMTVNIGILKNKGILLGEMFLRDVSPVFLSRPARANKRNLFDDMKRNSEKISQFFHSYGL